MNNLKDFWYTIRRFDLSYNCKKVKFFFQRGKRGWADCDVWNVDGYLAKIIPPMLKRLKETTHSYPGYGEGKTPEDWNALLDKMIEGWDAAKRVYEDEYVDTFQPGWFGKGEKITHETLDKCLHASMKDQKLFKSRMKIFTEWFFGLWD